MAGYYWMRITMRDSKVWKLTWEIVTFYWQALSQSQFEAMSTASESSGKLSTRNIIEMFTFLSDLYLLMSGLSLVGRMIDLPNLHNEPQIVVRGRIIRQ